MKGLSKMTSRKTRLGFGITLHQTDLETCLDGPHSFDFVEIVSENFLCSDHNLWHRLNRVSARYPVVLHGVSLSIGGFDPLDRTYLRRLRQLADFVAAEWISDHLCWTGVDGANLRDLLPLPLTEETLNHVCEKVTAVREILGYPFALENPSTYLGPLPSSMSEWEFMSRLTERSGCQLLIDVNNIYVSAFNRRFDPFLYINSLPKDSVIELHLGGHQDCGTFKLDTHDTRVSEPVWELYRHALDVLGPLPTVIEWDVDVPPLSTLEVEVGIARATRDQKLTGKTEWTEHLTSLGDIRRGSDKTIEQVALIDVQRTIQNEVLSCSFQRLESAPDSGLVAPLPYRIGLEVHAQNYHLRHLATIRSNFPVLNAVFGESFEDLAREYIETTRLLSVELSELPAEFALFLLNKSLRTASVTELAFEIALFDLTIAGVSFNRMVPALSRSKRLGPSVVRGVWLLKLNHGPYVKSFCAQAGIGIIWHGESSKFLAIYRQDQIVHVFYLRKGEYISMCRLQNAPGRGIRWLKGPAEPSDGSALGMLVSLVSRPPARSEGRST
jgi:uncharacterized protein (UPF0276 family)